MTPANSTSSRWMNGIERVPSLSSYMGPEGELLAVHNLQSLQLQDELAEGGHLANEDCPERAEWIVEAVMSFGPKEKYFFIRLYWGEYLIVELESGHVLRQGRRFGVSGARPVEGEEWRTLLAAADRRSRGAALAMLNWENPNERETGAIVAMHLGIRRAIPRLRELLSDDAVYSIDRRDFFPVRQAAKEALESFGEKVNGVVTERVRHGKQ